MAHNLMVSFEIPPGPVNKPKIYPKRGREGNIPMTSTLLNISPSSPFLLDLQNDDDFAERNHGERDLVREVEALQRLAYVFAANPQDILQELASISMELCGADSAGISLEETTEDGETHFRWIATAGAYAPFLGTTLPQDFSPSATCLRRKRPQICAISESYLQRIGVEAPPVTDGILIPWEVEQTRGTLWILAHASCTLFDLQDFRVLQNLANFAAIAIRHHEQQEILTHQAAATAAAAMANDLAHRINNPLQSLTNTVYLAAQGGAGSHVFAHQAVADLVKLSALVKDLLHLRKAY